MPTTLEPYDTSPVPEWDVKVLASCGLWRKHDSRLELVGRCPRCKDDDDAISAWVPADVWTDAVQMGSTEQMPIETLTDHLRRAVNEADEGTPKEYVWCQCRQPHDRTKTDKGCGAQGYVPVVAES